MTVKQLVELLETYPQEYQVFFSMYGKTENCFLSADYLLRLNGLIAIDHKNKQIDFQNNSLENCKHRDELVAMSLENNKSQYNL